MKMDLARLQGTQVAHSLSMVGELPGFVDDVTHPVALRVAAIDAFFVHLRLVIEFLIKPRDPRAISRHDYTSDFHLPADLRARLSDDYDFASRHVAHLNRERVPTEEAPIFEPVDEERLRSEATQRISSPRWMNSSGTWTARHPITPPTSAHGFRLPSDTQRRSNPSA